MATRTKPTPEKVRTIPDLMKKGEKDHQRFYHPDVELAPGHMSKDWQLCEHPLCKANLKAIDDIMGTLGEDGDE